MPQATGSAQPPIFHFDLLETLLKTVIASGHMSTAIRLSSTCSDLRAAAEKYLLQSLTFNSNSWFPQGNQPILTPCGCTLDEHGDPEKQVTKPKERFIGFSHLLDCNPRIATSVKCLSLCLTEAHLADIHMARILSRLRNVESLTWTIFRGPGTAPFTWKDVPPLVQELLVGIVERVSHLKLGGIWHLSPRFFSSCRLLVDLRLLNCIPDGIISATAVNLNKTAAAPLSKAKKLKLQSLDADLFSIVTLHTTLAHTKYSANPTILDFSDLATLRLDATGAGDELLHKLSKEMNSVAQLVNLEYWCHGQSATGGLSLNVLVAAFHPDSFHSLQSIKYTVGIAGDGNPFPGLVDALHRFPPDNDLQTLSIHITVGGWGVCSTSKEYWGQFNEILTETQFPSLRSVYVQLDMRYETDPVGGLKERFYVLADENFGRIKERRGVDFVFDLKYVEYLY